MSLGWPHLQTSRLIKFLVKLVAMRCKSLVATFLRPPSKYAAIAGGGTLLAKTVSQSMQRDWKLILEVEQAISSGQDIKPYHSAHFIKASFNRIFFLANERDQIKQQHGTDRSEAMPLAKAAVNHPGDSVIIENSHLKAKDILRESRHNQASKVHKFHAVFEL